MIPRKVTVENFLSYGSPAVEFDFDGEPLWILCGPNGAGKSAVFDAITYALFGCFRGSDRKSNKAEELIHHEASWCRVEYEFEFGGVHYRISRKKPARGQAKVSVAQCKSGRDWETLGDINGVRELEAWVADRLGLSFSTFVCSVMLRQGKAEEIIDADNATRLKVLHGIIDFEKYVQLHRRVADAAAEMGREVKTLRARFDGMPAVTEEDLSAAHEAAEQAEREFREARAAVRAAQEKLGHCRAWELLDRQCATIKNELACAPPMPPDLDAKLAAAEAQLAAARAAREALPHLEAAAEARAIYAAATEALADAAAAEKTALAEVDRLNAELRGVQSARAGADQQQREWERQYIEAASRLKDAQARLHRYRLFVGREVCSECGQPVDAGHVARELAKLQAEVDAGTHSDEAAGLALRKANERLAVSDKTLTTLQPQLRQRERQYDGAVRTREQTATKQRDAVATFKKAAKKLGEQYRHLLKEIDTGKFLTPKELAEVSARAQSVECLAEQVRHWQECQRQGALRASREEQLRALEVQIERVPMAARQPASAMEREVSRAEQRESQAEAARTRAANQLSELKRQAADRQQLAAALDDAGKQRDVHDRLAGLLGKAGLQRDLVRDAEREIVDLANETLSRLSNGDLRLERPAPAGNEDGEGEAVFDLTVRQAGAPNPIGLAFLSGSQRFRVAVALALAVGRFASRQARPLEAVIIDEGFGCLDRLGRLVMIEELQRLQRPGDLPNPLKRIILVSHHEDIADTFPVGYQLANVGGVTEAKMFRK